MIVFAVGSMDRKMVTELKGQPAVVLTGTIDEVRAAARFLFCGDVDIVSKVEDAVSSDTSREEKDHG